MSIFPSQISTCNIFTFKTPPPPLVRSSLRDFLRASPPARFFLKTEKNIFGLHFGELYFFPYPHITLFHPKPPSLQTKYFSATLIKLSTGHKLQVFFVTPFHPFHIPYLYFRIPQLYPLTNPNAVPT